MSLKKSKHLSFTVGQKKVRKDFLSSGHYWDGVIEHTIILLNILILPCLTYISRLGKNKRNVFLYNSCCIASPFKINSGGHTLFTLELISVKI